MCMQKLSATWLLTTCASLLPPPHALSWRAPLVSFAVQSPLLIQSLGYILQRKGSSRCYCVCYCYTQTQPLVANLSSHPAGNSYSFKDTVPKFDFVVQSVHQSEGERQCCTNNKLLGGCKMLSSNVL